MARTLKLTSPLMHGPDVKDVQHAINTRLHNNTIPLKIAEDGQYGTNTRAVLREVLYFLGLDVGQFDHLGLLPGVAAKLRNPDKRNATERGRARDRRAWLARFRKRLESQQNGPRLAIAYAKQHLGITESPAGSNRGRLIDAWERACGFLGASWCGMFANACLRAGGFPNQPWLAYCPTIEARAKGKVEGWSWHTPGNGKPGDLALYGPGVAEHVELYLGGGVDIGGNTSDGPGGSQSNGGGVFARRRDMSGHGAWPLRGFARPPWSKL